MTLVEFAKQKFQEHGGIPEFVEISYHNYRELSGYLRKNNVGEFMGTVLTFTLKLPKGTAKLYFEDGLEIYNNNPMI